MRKISVFLSVLIVFVLIYFLFFYTISFKSKDKNIRANSIVYKNAEFMIHKLSMKQIDSLTAFENYKFTIENYYKDVVPVKSAIEKSNKI
jgi:hypothetical protein